MRIQASATYPDEPCPWRDRVMGGASLSARGWGRRHASGWHLLSVGAGRCWRGEAAVELTRKAEIGGLRAWAGRAREASGKEGRSGGEGEAKNPPAAEGHPRGASPRRAQEKQNQRHIRNGRRGGLRGSRVGSTALGFTGRGGRGEARVHGHHLSPRWPDI